MSLCDRGVIILQSVSIIISLTAGGLSTDLPHNLANHSQFSFPFALPDPAEVRTLFKVKEPLSYRAATPPDVIQCRVKLPRSTKPEARYYHARDTSKHHHNQLS